MTDEYHNANAVHHVMEKHDLLGVKFPNPIPNQNCKVEYFENNHKILSDYYEVIFTCQTNDHVISISQLNKTNEKIRPSTFSSDYGLMNYDVDTDILTIEGNYTPTGKEYKVIIYCSDER